MTTDKILESIAKPESHLYTSSTGVKVRLKRVSALIISDAAQKLKAPRPPKVFIDDKGREEENPNDPEYIEEMDRYAYNKGYLAVTVYLTLGVEVLHRPDEIPAPESTEWSDEISTITGMEIPATGRARYLAWLKYIAFTETDVATVTTRIMRLNGVIEEADVVEALESFRNNAGLSTATGVPASTEGESRYRDGIPTDTSESNGAERLNEVHSGGARAGAEGSSSVRPRSLELVGRDSVAGEG